MPGTIRVGCAGWSLRKEHFELFPATGSHLERYAARFNCVEINSSFYRSHRTATYSRWAEATPHDFRFAVKLPKQSPSSLMKWKDLVQSLAPYSCNYLQAWRSRPTSP